MGRFELEGKRIIVSGAAGGIGAAVCAGLLNERAFPIGIDIRPYEGSELATAMPGRFKKGEDFDFYRGDASDEMLMRTFLNPYDRLDGLVNNAGLLGGDKKHGGINPDSLNKMLQAHVLSALVLTEIARAKMSEGGSVVNVGSIETVMAEPGVVLYATAKGALKGMTVAYAVELAPSIRVNSVSPGNVNTANNAAQYSEGAAKARIEKFEAKTPLRRSMEPFEIANQILFLLSPLSGGMTGQDVTVDGGYTRALIDPSW